MNEINRIRQLAGLQPVSEEVTPGEVEELTARYKNGEIDYNQLRDMLDSLEFTDQSMRAGEMGMIGGDTMAGHRAFDRERENWDALDSDFNDSDFDELNEICRSLEEEFGEPPAQKPWEELVNDVRSQVEMYMNDGLDLYQAFDKIAQDGRHFAPAVDQVMYDMSGGAAPTISEKAPPGMEDLVMKLKKEYPGEKEKAFATAWSIYNKKNLQEGNYWDEHIDPWHGNAAKLAKAPKSSMQGSKAWTFSEMVCDTIEKHGIRDAFQYYVVKHGLPPRMFKIFAAKALYPWKFNKEQKVGEDLNNGYDDVNYACGDDYFPDGADGPVVDRVGPSGARQGDNPEQKKMQVSELHKELVYGYRKFLEESSQKKR